MTKMSLKNLMVLVLSVSLVAGAVLASGCVGKAQIIENITPQEAFALIQENQDNPNFVIIDLRWPKLFAKVHIENAINIDYDSETFRDELNKLDKDKTYLIYYSCSCGPIDGKAVNMMAELNFREVYLLSGGLDWWKEKGFPTVGEGVNQ